MPRTKAAKQTKLVAEQTAMLSETGQPRAKTKREILNEMKRSTDYRISQVRALQKAFLNDIRSRYTIEMGLIQAEEEATNEAAKKNEEEKFAAPAPPSKTKAQRFPRKRSQSQASATRKCNPVLRSLSADRNNIRTPITSGFPFHSNTAMVTPKVDPTKPMAVMRRPRVGEFAMSLSGSPLIVSSVSSEAVPSINVPLMDGRMMAILPQDGMRDGMLCLDRNTREKLEKLRDNLIMCLNNKEP